jgi:hypothetical protein
MPKDKELLAGEELLNFLNILGCDRGDGVAFFLCRIALEQDMSGSFEAGKHCCDISKLSFPV